jgi:hypothetical protein
LVRTRLVCAYDLRSKKVVDITPEEPMIAAAVASVHATAADAIIPRRFRDVRGDEVMRRLSAPGGRVEGDAVLDVMRRH